MAAGCGPRAVSSGTSPRDAKAKWLKDNPDGWKRTVIDDKGNKINVVIAMSKPPIGSGGIANPAAVAAFGNISKK